MPDTKEVCLFKEQLKQPARLRCTSASVPLLSHSLSVAWQSLPHQASCDSLLVPALHLHWPVMSWQAFLLDSHPRFATLPIWRVNEYVYMHTSISAALRHDDLFHLTFESTSN